MPSFPGGRGAVWRWQRNCWRPATPRSMIATWGTAELNRAEHLRDPLLKQQHQTIAAEPTLARKAEIIASIPGLASNTAANLLAEMPELGTLPNKAAVSLAGLAPIARESGAWQGRRFIQGGRHPVRRLLYMPAVAAIRCNPGMKLRIRAWRRGWPHSSTPLRRTAWSWTTPTTNR